MKGWESRRASISSPSEQIQPHLVNPKVTETQDLIPETAGWAKQVDLLQAWDTSRSGESSPEVIPCIRQGRDQRRVQASGIGETV